MSGLTGYLTLDGIDLSSVFHSKNNNVFTSPISTTTGIMGVTSNNMTYNYGMIGCITTINVKANTSVVSNQITSLISFDLSAGVYLCYLYSYNDASLNDGSLIKFNLGISSVSGDISTDGFFETVFESVVLPTLTVNKFIIGTITRPLQVVSPKTYYFIHQINFANVTITNTPAPDQSHVKYVRIA
jgi:hypothetical protein